MTFIIKTVPVTKAVPGFGQSDIFAADSSKIRLNGRKAVKCLSASEEIEGWNEI